MPFWGIQSVEVRTLQNADTALLVSGSDGTTPYQLGFILTDAVEIKSFAEDLEAARKADAQRRAERPKVNIDSSLSPEEQHTALRQMREMTNMPDDAYEAAVRRIKESQTTWE